MPKEVHAVLVCILLLTISHDGWAAPGASSTIGVGPAVTTATGATPPDGRGGPNITWAIDFSNYAGGSIEAWLHTKGFRLEHGAEDPASLALSHHAGVLVFEAKQPVRGFVVNDEVKLEHVSTVRITRGVRKYPIGASYARKINNEALMLYISFGQDEIPSGHVLIPARPYFVGVFLGQEEPLNTPYQGQYFREGGRLCVSAVRSRMRRCGRSSTCAPRFEPILTKWTCP